MGEYIPIEPKFKEGDYIINRQAGDMMIVASITKKGYYHPKAYYGRMFDELKDVKNLNYDLQINYQKFFDLCTDEEREKMDNIIKTYKIKTNGKSKEDKVNKGKG